MSGFAMELVDAASVARIEAVYSFVGEDASGSFGILPGHARFMTCLSVGLARFRHAAGDWRYLAAPGATLYFVDNTLHLCTRRYLLDDDCERIARALTEQLLAEEESLRNVKKSLARLEQAMLKRLWTLGKDASPLAI
jgi:F-type H+-transporting ATPase subunit epsilon